MSRFPSRPSAPPCAVAPSPALNPPPSGDPAAPPRGPWAGSGRRPATAAACGRSPRASAPLNRLAGLRSRPQDSQPRGSTCGLNSGLFKRPVSPPPHSARPAVLLRATQGDAAEALLWEFCRGLMQTRCGVWPGIQSGSWSVARNPALGEGEQGKQNKTCAGFTSASTRLVSPPAACQ